MSRENNFRRRGTIAGLALAWCAVGPRAAGAASPYTVAQLVSIHKASVAGADSAMNAATRSGDSEQYYFTSIDLMGMLSAIDVTQDDAEMQQALRYIDQMVSATVTDRYQDIHGASKTRAVWGPLSGSDPNELYTYQGAQPIARAAALIEKIPAFRAKYGAKAQTYAAFVDGVVIQRWYVDAYGQAPEWLTGDPPDWGDNGEWNDKSWLLGDIASSLYQATGQASYLALANQISAAFKGALKPLNAGWIWNDHTIPIGSDTDDEPGSVGNQEGSPDTDHANRVPMMMIYQYEAGIGGWSLGDVRRLAATLADTMWNQSTAQPSVSNYVDGSNKPYRTHARPGENGFIFSGWAICGKYSDKAQTAAASMLQAVQNGVQNPSVGENSDDYYKTVGLSGHVLWAVGSASSSATTAGACDLNADGRVNISDVQEAVNQVLGLAPCASADLQKTGKCNSVDLQRVVDATLGDACRTGS